LRLTQKHNQKWKNLDRRRNLAKRFSENCGLRFCLACLFAGLAAGGCGAEPDGAGLVLENDRILVDFDVDRGCVSIRGKDDDIELRCLYPAFEEALDNGQTRLRSGRGRPMQCAKSGAQVACVVNTGAGLRAEVTIGFTESNPFAISWEAVFGNVSGADVGVSKFYPFRLGRDEGGALSLGDDPSRVRVLQNGTDEFIDFYADMLAGDIPVSDPDQDPLFASYSSYSNGNLTACDLESGSSMLSGFLSLNWAIPLVAMGGDADALTDLRSEARYPQPVIVLPGNSISAGRAVFIVGMPTPQAALEAYADLVAEEHDIQLPPLPASGWDSWYTSFQNTDISADFILQNADALESTFGPFGLNSMQLDEGWQDNWGDWNAADAFPAGMQAMAAVIAARGLAPELWMAPLSANENSQVYQEHPDWFAEKSLYGSIIMDPSMHPFDLTQPDTLTRVRELGARIRDWGFKSVKMDFAYYALFAKLPPDPDTTPVALYRRAVSQFRKAVGTNTYFINISMCFPNYGLVDAFRIGLDDWPCWEGGNDCTGYVTTGGDWAQGIKPAVRMAARRYWMNGRIWWNHHDQIFFRDQTADEARAFVSLAGLSGGMLALGEEVGNLTPEQIDVFRRILPLTGRGARPEDLFRLEFPETWRIDLEDSRILGLFHWGRNNDLTQNPAIERPDGTPITSTIELADLGMDPNREHVAYEFWSGDIIYPLGGELTAEIAPHTAQVYKIVELSGEPVFIATDRHILMGAGIVDNLFYAAETRTLTGQVRTSPAFPQKLVFFIPANLGISSIQLDGVDNLADQMQDQNFLVLTFTGRDADAHGFKIEFQQK